MRHPRLVPAAALLAASLAGWPAAALDGAGPEAPSGPAEASPSHPPGAAADLRPRLTLDLSLHASVTGGLLLASGGVQLLGDRLGPARCRWCEPARLDRWARTELRWARPGTAATLSDALVLVVPASAALALGLGARAQDAGAREVLEDLVAVAEGVAVATAATQVAKLAAGRRRPDAWAAGGAPGAGTADSRRSFWSGHTSLVFSVAAGATQVARLRDRPGWRWLALASFAGAAATGWLRVAGDRHWLTDAAVGAAVGTAAGLAVPALVLRPEERRSPAVRLVPAPGGVALVF